jgi:membrane-associated phospholipid phosphatase
VVVKSGILLFIERQRPFVATAEEVDALIDVSRGEYLQSFPSGHAVFFFALAMVIWNFDLILLFKCKDSFFNRCLRIMNGLNLQ